MKSGCGQIHFWCKPFRPRKLYFEVIRWFWRIFCLSFKFPWLKMLAPFFSKCDFSELLCCSLIFFARRKRGVYCHRHASIPWKVFQWLFQLFPSKFCSFFPRCPEIWMISFCSWAGLRENSDSCWFCRFLSNKLFVFSYLDISLQSYHKGSTHSILALLGCSPRCWWLLRSLIDFIFQGQNWASAICSGPINSVGRWIEPTLATHHLKSQGDQKRGISCCWSPRSVCRCLCSCHIASPHHHCFTDLGLWANI